MELEHEPQRHLDLSRASDGLVRDAQAAQRRADGWRLTGRRKAVDIETRSISHVEDIERELQGGALGYFRYLRERNVRAPLPGLAENTTLAVVDEVRLVRIIGRDRAVKSARRKA